MASVQNNFDLLPEMGLGDERIKQYQKSAPVDVVGLAESFGLRVWELPLPEDVSGKIILDPKHGGTAQYSIIVRKEEPKVRKRFTVAHELAHFLLHRNFIGDGVSDSPLYRSKLSTLQEVQANRKAADILMPLTLLEVELKKGALPISELASRFEVSEQAMRIRLGVPN